MRPGSGYLSTESTPPLKGLATAMPSNKIDPAYSPRLLNVIVRDGIVKRRPGGDQLGRRLLGTVLAITEFGKIGEDPWFLVMTSRRQYIYDPGTTDFKDITQDWASRAITAVNTGTKTFKIAGNHTADFTVSQIIPVVGGANEGFYTVVSATLNAGNTDIVVTETIPSAVVGGAIETAKDLTTQEGDFISFVAITDLSGRRFVMTNGRDVPQLWSGDDTDQFEDWAPNFTDFVTCKVMAIFSEHLFLGDITTTDEEPQLVAWSEAGDFDEFEDGDSGEQLLYQLTNPIKAMELLGDRLVIYSDDVIMTGLFIGLPAVFQFEVVIPAGTRLTSPKGISSINVGHIFCSEENFYLFDGTRGLRVLTDAMYNDYKENKDQENLSRTALFNDFSKRTIYFAVPDINEGSIIFTMFYDVFDLTNIAWAKEKYEDNVRAWGFFTNRSETLVWEDASWEIANMPWSNELGTWGEEAEQINFPIRCYGTSDGRVIIATEGSLADRGVVPEQSYETKDFEVPGVVVDRRIVDAGESLLGRWGEVEFEAWGTQVNVIASKDKGHTYQGLQTVALTETPEVYRVPLDIMSRTMRIKFISTGSNFSLRWIRLWVKPGSPR